MSITQSTFSPERMPKKEKETERGETKVANSLADKGESILTRLKKVLKE